MRTSPGPGMAWLLLPGLAMLLLLFLAPGGMLLVESISHFDPGRVGGTRDAGFTLDSYRELIDVSYLRFFGTTLKLAMIACIVSLLAALPLAMWAAQGNRPRLRRMILALAVSLLLLSALVRVYAIEISFGPVGLMRWAGDMFGITTNSRAYLELMVVGGLCHFIVPIAIIMLLGTLQNLNPRLSEAAASLGASRMQTFLRVTLPLCIPGLSSAFFVGLALGLGAYVVPMILGKGKVTFIANLIQSRFSEMANYPSGAALSVLMLVVSATLVMLVSIAVSRLARSGARG